MNPPDAENGGKRGRRGRQLTLDLATSSEHVREDYLVGAANLEAWLLLSSWPDWPHPVTRLQGGPATGKSHAAKIWAESANARIVPHDAITDELPRIIADETERAWLVEDADRPGRDETGLFHLVNHAMETGASLLLTARAPIGDWGVELPDLLSRLRAANIVRLGAPDPDLLELLLVKLFADRQIDIDPKVASYASRRIERSFAAAVDLVAHLDRESLEQSRAITVPLVARAIEETDNQAGTSHKGGNRE